MGSYSNEDKTLAAVKHRHRDPQEAIKPAWSSNTAVKRKHSVASDPKSSSHHSSTSQPVALAQLSQANTKKAKTVEQPAVSNANVATASNIFHHPPLFTSFSLLPCFLLPHAAVLFHGIAHMPSYQAVNTQPMTVREMLRNVTDIRDVREVGNGDTSSTSASATVIKGSAKQPLVIELISTSESESSSQSSSPSNRERQRPASASDAVAVPATRQITPPVINRTHDAPAVPQTASPPLISSQRQEIRSPLSNARRMLRRMMKKTQLFADVGVLITGSPTADATQILQALGNNKQVAMRLNTFLASAAMPFTPTPLSNSQTNSSLATTVVHHHELCPPSCVNTQPSYWPVAAHPPNFTSHSSSSSSRKNAPVMAARLQ